MAQYPPIIAASLQPAIYKTIDYKDYIYLTVPFEFGRATNVQTIQSIKWIIKSSIQNTQITAGEIRNSDSDFTETIQNKIINLNSFLNFEIYRIKTVPIFDVILF